MGFRDLSTHHHHRTVLFVIAPPYLPHHRDVQRVPKVEPWASDTPQLTITIGRCYSSSHPLTCHTTETCSASVSGGERSTTHAAAGAPASLTSLLGNTGGGVQAAGGSGFQRGSNHSCQGDGLEA